jgi:preprotein translocase subunit SecA
MEGRRWCDGLHQAIEAKEGVEIQPRARPSPTITYQNYFRMYDKLAGMTGTADTEAEEFNKIYNLDVVVIPPNRKMVRQDLDDLVYKNERGKFRAVVEEIKQAHERGQPVLVGTASVEKSQVIHTMLDRMGIPHEVSTPSSTSARRTSSPRPAARAPVTVATNMAGRGTDILLGGNAEMVARSQIDPDKDPARFEALHAALKDRVREGEGGGQGPRRPLHRRHRASREPPHRQPAARPRLAARATRAARASSSRSRTT